MKIKIIILIVLLVIGFFIIDNCVNSLMMKGVNNYYGLNQDSKILLIGHSHLMLSVDKEKLERELGMKVSKYCREGVNVSDRKVMVDHFLNSGHADSLEYMLYGVDLATFTKEGLSDNSYKLFYPFMDNENIDIYIKSQSGDFDYILHKLIKTTRFHNDGLKNSALRGLFHNWDNFKSNVIDIEEYREWQLQGNERHIKMNEQLIEEFKETIKSVTDRGIKVILVNSPTVDLLNQYEPDKYSKVMAWFKEYANNDELIYFLDFNPKYESNYNIFSDRIHLNKTGQQIITDEIINYIKRMDRQKSKLN